MILNNYWKWLYELRDGFSVSEQSLVKTDTTIKNLSGNYIKIVKRANLNAYTIIPIIYNFTLRNNLSIRVGSGTNAESADDYNLGDDKTAQISNYTNTINVSFTDNSLKAVISVSGVNNSETPITISEVGIVKTLGTGYNSSLETDNVLIARKLLTTPLTVGAGNSFSLTFEWIEQ